MIFLSIKGIFEVLHYQSIALVASVEMVKCGLKAANKQDIVLPQNIQQELRYFLGKLVYFTTSPEYAYIRLRSRTLKF